jgi:hypothetical protein
VAADGGDFEGDDLEIKRFNYKLFGPTKAAVQIRALLFGYRH